MVDFLYWIDRLRPEQRSAVGDKAWNLGQLQQQGYPTVPGFVVSALALQRFLEQIDWPEPLFADLPHSSLRLDIENAGQLQSIAQRLRLIVQTQPLPPEWSQSLNLALAELRSPMVSLRVSLSLPSPGSQRKRVSDSSPRFQSSALFQLHVCPATAAAVETALKQLWAELFSAKSLFYWQRSGVPQHQVNLAVLVQPIGTAIASGTAVIQGQTAEIAATLGLGMAIDWGEVVPDRYRLDLNTGAVQPQSLGQRTIAYGVDQSSLLQTALPDDPPFSLGTGTLQTLVALGQQLAPGLKTALELGWCLRANTEPALVLTYATPRSLPLSPLQDDEPPLETDALLVSGLAASPGQVVAQAWVVTPMTAIDPVAALPPRTVLVAPTVPPAWMHLLQQSAALVTEQGSLTYHSAIVARELGIPAVVAATHATTQIQTGDWVIVDGDRGKVYRTQPPRSPDPLAPDSLGPKPTVLPSPRDRPAIRTRLLINLNQTRTLPQAAALPVAGIGLVRSELWMLSLLDYQHPNLWVQKRREAELVAIWAEGLRQLAAALSPRPVFYRSLDLRSHEFSNLPGTTASSETNPMLGLRGTFRSVLDPTLFDLELAALAQVQQAGYRNLRLILPFVRTVEEFQFCRQRVEQAGLTHDPQFQLWIMAEVPSVLFLLPDYVRAGVQGISIGTNDLTQLLLGVDRDQGQMAAAFDERHPAVQAAIAQLIQQARRLNIPCSLCGQAAVNHPELVDRLVRWGITAISVEPEAVESTYWAIVRAERSQG
jgi:pyruvate, water dikinase